MKSGLINRLFCGLVFGLTLYGLAYARPLDPKPPKKILIGFYNVENLFDTIDDPIKKDEEYTPGSEKNWNSERYRTKLNRLAEVIDGMGGEEYPAILGVCEVENLGALTDLAEVEALRKAKYRPVLIEGPDQRGIDVGMLYSKKKFKPLDQLSYSVDLGEENRPTRDILHVKGKIKRGPIIHVLVNHWPSRYGGAEESEHKRVAAALVLANVVDSINKASPEEPIICMGDFNDYPENRSLDEVLPTDAGELLVNLMEGLAETKRGSYNYRGDWGFLDQILVSNHLTNEELPYVLRDQTQPFFTDSMLYVHPKYGDTKPSRTYGGDNYYGGYSDHLPVYTVLAY